MHNVTLLAYPMPDEVAETSIVIFIDAGLVRLLKICLYLQLGLPSL